MAKQREVPQAIVRRRATGAYCKKKVEKTQFAR